MVKFLRVAYRNVIRHKRRALLMLFMITIVVAITLILEGFLEASRQGWLTSVIHSETGHIQIMRKGYMEAGPMAPLDLLITRPEEIKAILNGSSNAIIGLTERLSFGGMIATWEKTAIFGGIGVDPVNEYDIFDLIDVKKGTRLIPNQDSGTLIGSGLAKNLEINIGDPVTLISNTVEGAINAINMEVVGIFHSGTPQVDNMALFVPLASAQRLLNVPNQVSSIVVLLDDINLVDKKANEIRGLMKERRHDIEVVTWQDLATLFKRVQSMNRFQANIVGIIMFSLITMAICIIMLMAVFERTREIGTMTAFGIRKGEVMSLFLCESMIIGIIGGLLGALLGIGVTGVLNMIGIPFNPPDTDILIYLRPVILYDRAVYVFFIAVVTAGIGGFYPAVWASTIRPSEAFRFV